MAPAKPYPPYDSLPGKMVAYAEAYLKAVGIDQDTPHTEMTAFRLTHYLKYLLEGADDFHLTVFDNKDPKVDHMVVVPHIHFWSACSHHMLPFTGTASIGYIPNKILLGLSKIPLLVRSISRGFWLQEHLAHIIADRIEEAAQPQGVGVYIEAQHTCQLLDLKEPPIPIMKLAVLRGVFLHGDRTREEFYHLIG